MKNSVVSVFGYLFNNYSTPELAAKIMEHVKKDNKILWQIVTVNMDFIDRAKRDEELRYIIKSSNIVTADGMPIIWVSKLFGKPLKERVTGSDLTPILIKEAEKNEVPLFFLGGTIKENEIAIKNLKRDYPKLKTGNFSPEVKPLLAMENEEILEKIAEIKPKILFLSLGSKAEKWARMNRDQLEEIGVKAVIGVGATIKFLAGTVNRAPLWMQKNGLEWFYRLMQEPTHLYKRYSRNFVALVAEVVHELWRSSEQEFNGIIYNRRIFASPIVEDLKIPEKGVLQLKLKNKIQVYHLNKYKKRLHKVIYGDEIQKVEIDFLRVTFLDSAALGYLLRMNQEMTMLGKELKILRISPQLYNLFKFRKLDDFLDMDFYVQRKPPELDIKYLEEYKNKEILNDGLYFFNKRIIDLAGTTVGLALSAPIVLLAGLAIKLEDGGPIFFKQVRVGKGGKPFYIYKLRSMVLNAEELKVQLEDKAEIKGKIFKMKNDPRITKVGKFLRKTSIDEMPQFYNVFRGEMSLVGPRPAIDHEVGKYSYEECGRVVKVKPGITGITQIRERLDGKLNFEEQIKYDFEYIEKRNSLLDLWILFKTVYAVLKGSGE
ncbi:WecB/TagA/CpsF family glycosyltransferase [Psychrilyobacter atlanticus]|uniref:WecB/TagA/CpsF family glycosyltransferase n=1 Tax=Psychrilyobacter atlanticus TaxID=271091 RepID=UPI00042756DE|nr:WecB/TagA/CpsF family glycosyltransferase [Psychrilyobacter atlanticus]